MSVRYEVVLLGNSLIDMTTIEYLFKVINMHLPKKKKKMMNHLLVMIFI